LDQLAQYNNASKPTYYVHRNWDSKVGSETAGKLVNMLLEKGHAPDLDININSVPNGLNWRGLPPSSLQTFLAKQSNLTGIVITNHDDKGYVNKFYNSILDDDQNIGYKMSDDTPGATVQGIASLVAAITRTVEQLVFPNGVPNKAPKDVGLVNDILYCYVESANCPLFLHLRKDEMEVVERTFPLYAGVFGRYARFTLASDATAKLLTYWTGQIVNKSEEDCKHDSEKPIFDYLWLNGSCYNSSLMITPAQSPAFIIDDYDWSSGEYSTWTESSWNHFSVRIYLKPSLAHDLFTLFLGLAVFILSSLLIWWVNEKAEFIFESRGERIC
jgi:nicastrin